MVMKLVWDFLGLAIISIIIGLTIGLLISWLFKLIDMKNQPTKETSLVFLFGYLSYMVAELLEFSGIISMFCCGIIFSYYLHQSLSKQSQEGTHLAFSSIGFLCEAFIWTYLGLTFFSISYSSFPVLYLIGILVSLCIARFVTVYIFPIGFLIFRRDFGIDRTQLKITWYSGLIRGAIAFGLSS